MEIMHDVMKYAYTDRMSRCAVDETKARYAMGLLTPLVHDCMIHRLTNTKNIEHESILNTLVHQLIRQAVETNMTG